MVDKDKSNGKSEGEKTTIKNLGFCSFGIGANSAEVDVKDGKILRIRPLHFDKEYDPKDLNPWEIKARGKTFKPSTKSLLPPLSLSYKKRVYSPNRIKYPLKRVDWDPDGERNPQNRGTSKYVRISWDEATDIIAKEIRRIHDKYGPYAILAQADGHGETKTVHGPHGCQTRLLELMGGYTLQVRQPDSWEGWYWGAKHAWGMDPVGKMSPQTNVMKDIMENSDMLLFWGADPETTTWGWQGQMSSRLCYHFSDLGIKSVFICPDLNYAAAVHADKWIPVKPNTDAALHLAISYVWLTEDLYEKEYVATHTYGFENYRDYVLGKEDGIPKTPKWAAEITGIPSYTIKALAREWGKKKTSIGHCNGGSYIRASYSTEPGRLEVLNLAMQGLGMPGRHQVTFIEWQLFGLHTQNPMPRSMVIPDPGAAYRGYWLGTFPKQHIPKTLIPDSILKKDEKLTWYGHTMAGMPREDQFIKFEYPVEGCSRLHMIWTDTPCWMTCWNGGHRMQRALQDEDIEFVVAQHPWMENECIFADIILPINTKLEEEDIGIDIFSGSWNHIFYEGKSIEPIGESLSDYEAVGEVAKKLGLYEEYTKGNSIEDWIKLGYETSGVQEIAPYEQFRDKEYVMVPTDPDWEDLPAGMVDFLNDPDNNPIDTPSGKIEFYASGLAEHFPDDKERPPVPHWIPYGEFHQENQAHPRAEEYPFLIVSNHPRWRVHAMHDDITWLREIPTCKVKGADGYLYEPVWINPKDAKPLGIKDGDVVELYNERGGVLGGAYVTERIRPGVIYQDHGARVDPLEVGKLDRGGANNLICPHHTTSPNAAGEVTSGYLVGVRKVDLQAMTDEYPDQFGQEFHPTAGLLFKNRLEGGK
ncbi:molybdopterin-dependent oxidoreductase [bacterium]|nr:molybdopterin-dependent oxidoreductase [bacterium]